jgi:D-sedoheptulose 7-phosphate isomerase
MAATAQSRQDSIAEHFRRSRETLDHAASDGAMMQAMIRATDAMAAALRGGNKILIAGNGGTPPMPAYRRIPLSAQLRSQPAASHRADHRYLCPDRDRATTASSRCSSARSGPRPQGRCAARSISGRSPNILAGLRAARAAGVTTVGFTGISDSPMLALCDITLRAPTDSTP